MENNLWSEREEIMQSLSRYERKLLHEYEREHGRLYPGAIYKVIEDQKELDREKKRKKRKK